MRKIPFNAPKVHRCFHLHAGISLRAARANQHLQNLHRLLVPPCRNERDPTNPKSAAQRVAFHLTRAIQRAQSLQRVDFDIESSHRDTTRAIQPAHRGCANPPFLEFVRRHSENVVWKPRSPGQPFRASLRSRKAALKIPKRTFVLACPVKVCEMYNLNTKPYYVC